MKKVPVAILEIVINLKNSYIDRSFRFFQCENELLQKTLLYLAYPSFPSLSKDGKAFVYYTNEKFMRCSHEEVVFSQIDLVINPNIAEKFENETS